MSRQNNQDIENLDDDDFASLDNPPTKSIRLDFTNSFHDDHDNNFNTSVGSKKPKNENKSTNFSMGFENLSKMEEDVKIVKPIETKIIKEFIQNKEIKEVSRNKDIKEVSQNNKEIKVNKEKEIIKVEENSNIIIKINQPEKNNPQQPVIQVKPEVKKVKPNIEYKGDNPQNANKIYVNEIGKSRDM